MHQTQCSALGLQSTGHARLSSFIFLMKGTGRCHRWMLFDVPVEGHQSPGRFHKESGWESL